MGDKSSFRKDINGLRAIAVITVVVFHFDERLLRRGLLESMYLLLYPAI